jgi:hypothetical protein
MKPKWNNKLELTFTFVGCLIHMHICLIIMFKHFIVFLTIYLNHVHELGNYFVLGNKLWLLKFQKPLDFRYETIWFEEFLQMNYTKKYNK